MASNIARCIGKKKQIRGCPTTWQRDNADLTELFILRRVSINEPSFAPVPVMEI